MASINIDEIVPLMIAAAKSEFGQKWPTIKDYAEAELEKLARTLVQIETLKLTKQIDEGEAGVLLEMQKNTARAVMLALEGMALILVEAAINAALKAAKKIVNDAIGFILL
ncbi:hypothetical protein L2088_30315 [Pseudomonas protegens]|uniref:hypothetical protein n=1 Tax=Pseudomonas protegens TaxID=380021 RepID=UPI0020250872|nr:hypothetical protein [Pseudomonas protegens]MCL9658999.1 hypothetical protein [Pseudomonas protegens]